MSKKYDTIIVGGGIAGLTSAAYLARSGQKVLLVEKNKECGGLVNSFTRDGFQFDAGVRSLEDAGIIFPMLKDLGIELEFVKSPVSVGVEDEILKVNDYSSLFEYKSLLIRAFPESESEIESLIKIIRKVMRHMEILYGLENPAFKDLKRDKKYIFKELLPWLPRFIFTVGKINRMNGPIEDYLESFISNPSLRDVVAQHFFKNTPAFFALSYFSLYLDYFYPKGGVGKLAEAVENKIIEFGGEIQFENEITKVLAGDKLVLDKKGESYKYDNLVWAADLKTLYNVTSIQGLPEKVKTKYSSVKAQMLKSRGGDSVFSIFVEVDKPLDYFREISSGHFFYTPLKTGLGKTHTKELNILLNNWNKHNKNEVIEWLDKFTRLNTYEISIPGLKDASLVPDGKTGIAISFLAEYDLFAKVADDDWYPEFRAEIEKRVISVLSDSVFPVLKDKVIKYFSFSPLSIKNRVGSSEGAITGWSFEKAIPVLNKIQYSGRSVLTPIPSVFQAGQWAYSPAGVPMSILTGKLAADKIIKN